MSAGRDESLDERRARLADAVQHALERGEPIDPVRLARTHGVTRAEVERVHTALAALLGEDERAVGPATEPPRPLPRPQLPPNYELLEELGRGGMGVVYRCRQRDLDREVAVKVLMPGELLLGESLARFRREARSLARLTHPHVVRILEVGEHAGRVFYAMDLVDGRSLAKVLAHRRPSVSESVRLVRQVADAMAYVHERGLVHRDLKPANVLVDQAGDAFVVDFGLAYDEHDATLTRTGHLLGTPAYMSPEQARGDAAEVGERSDVHAVGALLFECLTGRTPFGDRPLVELIQAVATETPPKPSQLNKRVPVELDWVVARAMAKDPEERYPTMRALLEDLERFERGEAVRALPPGFWDGLRRWAGRRRATLVSAAVTALVAVGVYFVFVRPELRGTDRLLEEARRYQAAFPADPGIREFDLRHTIPGALDTAGSLFRTLRDEGVELEPEEELLVMRLDLRVLSNSGDTARLLLADEAAALAEGTRPSSGRGRRSPRRVSADVRVRARWTEALASLQAGDRARARTACEDLLSVDPVGSELPALLRIELDDLVRGLAEGRETPSTLGLVDLLVESSADSAELLSWIGEQAASGSERATRAIERLLRDLPVDLATSNRDLGWLELLAPLGRAEALRVLARVRDGDDAGAAARARALAARVMDLPLDPALDAWSLLDRVWPTDPAERVALLTPGPLRVPREGELLDRVRELEPLGPEERMDALLDAGRDRALVHRALVVLDPEPTGTPVFRTWSRGDLFEAWSRRLGLDDETGLPVCVAVLQGDERERELRVVDVEHATLGPPEPLGPELRAGLGLSRVGEDPQAWLTRPAFLDGTPSDPAPRLEVELTGERTWWGVRRALRFSASVLGEDPPPSSRGRARAARGEATEVLHLWQNRGREPVHAYVLAWSDPPADLDPWDAGAWLARTGDLLPEPKVEEPEPRTPEQERKDRRFLYIVGGLVAFVGISVLFGIYGGVRSLLRRGVDWRKVLSVASLCGVSLVVVLLQTPRLPAQLDPLPFVGLLVLGAVSALGYGWPFGGAARWLPPAVLGLTAGLAALALFGFDGAESGVGRALLAWATLGWPIGVITLGLPSVRALDRFVQQDPRIARNVWVGLVLLEALAVVSAVGIVLWTNASGDLARWGLGLSRLAPGHLVPRILSSPSGLWIVMSWFQWTLMVPISRMEQRRQRAEREAERAAARRAREAEADGAEDAAGPGAGAGRDPGAARA